MTTEGSVDEDLLGMRPTSNKSSRSPSPANNLTVAVNVVELGEPINVDELGEPIDRRVSGDAAVSSSSKAKMRRKKSPGRDAARFIRSITGSGHGDGPPSSRPQTQRPRRKRESGTKMYQGRANRRQDQQQSQQQQSSTATGSSQQQQQHQHPQQGQGRERRSAAAAPWADIKKQVRRRSRDGASELRRRSREGVERVRRISVDYKNKNAMATATEHNELEQIRNERTKQPRRLSMEQRASQENGGNIIDASQQSNRRVSMEGGNVDELEQLREQMKQQKRNSNGSNTGKMERRMSKSMGHALKGKNDEGAERERKHSKSLLDSSDYGIPALDDDDSKHDGQQEKQQEQNKPKAGSENDRKNMMLINRRASLDSSLRDLQAGKDYEPSTRGRLPPRPRRLSLESSMKLGESATKMEISHLFEPMSRRRSNSLDNSWRKGDAGVVHKKQVENRRRESVDRGDYGETRVCRRRSLSEGDDVLSEMKRETSIDDDMLLRMYAPSSLSGNDNKRKTHMGVVASSDNRSKKESSSGGIRDKRKGESVVTSPDNRSKKESSSGGIGDKRKSETDAFKKKKNSDRGDRRGSYDVRKIEAAKRAWSDTHGKQKTAGDSEQRRRSTKKSTEATAQQGSADKNSVNSKTSDQSPAGNDEEDQSSGKSSIGREKKKGCRVSPCCICTICLCYCLSILLFGGLGFWVHMNYFADKDTDDDTTITSNSDNNMLGNDGSGGGSTKNDNGPEGGTQTPGMTPSSLGPPNNTGQQSTMNNTDGSLVTKLSPTTMNPSYLPSNQPSFKPSFMPSTSFPTSSPTDFPTTTPSLSIQPTPSPSDTPSSSPTFTPECPEQLLKSASLGEDNLLTLRYEIIIYQDHMDGGGLLCASLDYAGGDAAWIGVAFSTASRLPQYGKKEAIIGIPGMKTTVAVGTDGTASLGQQIVAIEGDGFVNPAKYDLPAGGIGTDGYSGPSLSLLRGMDQQTLVNASVAITDPYGDGGIIISNEPSNKRHTQMSFVKYLKEPNEVEINPNGETLLLYAVAALPDNGVDEYDGNPEWKYAKINFLESSSAIKSLGLVRKRKRQHTHS